MADQTIPESPMPVPSILVVDDSPSLRRMIGACLRAGGYTVTEASDGKEAHEVAREGSFDMLVTDQVMPAMDGLSLIRALRGTPAYASIPMLMLSTEHDERILDQARAAGASGFLAKPFDPDQLMASVEALLTPPNEG